MSTARRVQALEPVQWLYLWLDPGGFADHGPAVLRFLARTLDQIDWRGHLVVLGWPEADPDLVEGVADAAADHLERNRFASLSMHVMVEVEGLDSDRLRRLVAPAQRLQAEAYGELGESRLAVHPILVAGDRAEPVGLRAVVDELGDLLAPPRVLLAGAASAGLMAVLDGAAIRIHLAPAGGDGRAAVAESLAAHHVLESLLERIEGDRRGMLEPCSRHLLVDPARGGLFACLGGWRSGAAPLPLDGGGAESDPVGRDECPQCIAWAGRAVVADLEANQRQDEGHRVLLRTAVALAERGTYGDAADLAGAACRLATTDPDRASTLLHRGLCCLEAGRLAEADEALQRALGCGADPALIAFQRGRVEMAWPDEIAALERLEEALASPSDRVPSDDVHLQMGICHVNLAEYEEARRHLESVSSAGHRPVVAFYRGLCELREGRAESALAHLEEALAAGPAVEDLGRVLLYLATCLKELGRFAEAIAPLQRAIELEPAELAHRNLLGYCLYRLGCHAEAAACFERAVALAPRSAIDWSNLGANLRELGRLDEGEAAYLRALVLDPGLGLAIDGLARLRALRDRRTG